MVDKQNQVLTALTQMMTKVGQRFDQITTHVDNTRSDVMTKMDAVYKEVLAMRQRQIAHDLRTKK
jgi:CII-binding regulator of phage lambda lysogenization HflD